MAISWGKALRNGFQGVRIGVSVSWSHVGTNTSKATATVRYYIQVRAHSNDDPTLHMTGAITGSKSFHNNHGQNGNPHYLPSGGYLIATKTYTYTYGGSEYGSSPGTRTFAANLTGTYNGLHPTVSVKSKIPARPYAKPATPGDAHYTYKSDTRARISWSRHSTAKAPYRSQQVWRYRWVKNDNAYDGGHRVATLSGNATSWTDTGIVADNVYYWRVRAGNPAGWSGFNSNGDGVSLNTTPDAPSNVRCRVDQGDTSQVNVTWSNETYHVHQVVYDVQRSDNGGSWHSVHTTGNYATSWTDTSPAAGSNRYRIRSRVTVGNTLHSGYATSNTVTTIVPPLAPTDLSPDGGAADATNDIDVSWTYRDGGDGIDQTAFQVRWSDDGGDNWTTSSTVTSTDSSWTISANTLSNGETYKWQVRTQAVPSEGWGPWSDSATIATSAAPVVAITSPSATVASGHLTVEWTYTQSDGLPQSLWRAVLYTSDGETVVESLGAADASTSASFDEYLVDTQSYVVEVTALAAGGVFSDPVTQLFTVDMPDVATITTTAEYDIDTGTMLLSLSPDDPEAGETAADAATIERSVDGGETWVRLTRDEELPFDFVDLLPTVMGENIYRVTPTAYDGSIPFYGETARFSIMAPSGANGPSLPARLPFQLGGPPGMVFMGARSWLFISFGSTFDQLLRARSNVEVSSSSGRSSESTAYLGRRNPRASFGQNRSREVDVKLSALYPTNHSSDLDYFKYDSPPVDWEQLAQEATIVCLRDYTGRRIFGHLDGGISRDDVRPGRSDISFKVIEDDYVERYD